MKTIEYFLSNPCYYFTENDLVADLVRDIKKELGHNLFVEDKSGTRHCRVHTEYPTPFRCAMRNKEFALKDEDDRTQDGKKYKRGHYDIVVLSEDFIINNENELIQGQDWVLMRNYLNSNPATLFDHGYEVMLFRQPIKYSRGVDKEKEINNKKKLILQDYKKLCHTHKQRLMEDFLMLVFVRDVEGGVVKLLKEIENERLKIISA